MRKGRRLPRAALLALGSFIALWYGASFGLLSERRRFLLPPPHRVVTEAVVDPGTGEWGPNLSNMLQATLLTALVAFVGLTIATLLGMSIAIVMHRSTLAERVLYPYAVGIQVVPVLALVPLIGLWFDFGFVSRVIACVLICLFPVIANTHFGLRTVSAQLQDLFTMAGSNAGQRLVKLELPAARAAILSGIRIAAGGAVIGAIVADFFFRQGRPGIGRLIDRYSRDLQTEDLIVAVGLAVLLGLAFFALVGLVDRLTDPRGRSAGALR
jgi:NitT/TauT family transport system permease protein